MTVNQRTEENRRIEEKIKMMQRTILDISIRNVDIWCALYMIEGHTEYTCWHRDDRVQDVFIICTEYFCEICREITSHETKDFPFNLRNKKSKWCAICEENSHDT